MDPNHRRSYGYIAEPEKPGASTKPRNAAPILGTSTKRFLLGLLTTVKAVVLLPFKLLLGFLTFLLHRKRSRMGASMMRVAFKLGVIALVIGTIAGVGIIAWASRDLPDPNRLTDRAIAQSTKIYDRTGTHLLYEIFANEKRTIVPLDQIPADVVHGVVATEDKEFYNHHGVRVLSFMRSIFDGIIHLQRPRGTSTLTQQLVKNAILTNERSYIRKLKEIILAIRLEQKYSKDQILQIYFNEIPYGSTNYGIEAAAQSYFGKSVRDLNLQESATLAGMPQRPSVFLQDPDALKTRRNFVLRRMYEEGYITKEQKETAQAEPLTLQQRLANKIEAPHFVMYVKQQLDDQFGETTVNTGGFRVITTLDWDKQKLAEKAVEDNSKIFTDANANNIALVAMDPRSGEVLSMIGSRDFFDPKINGQYNVAVQGKRQPGSSFKPMIYTAAFEKGYTPDTVLFDVSTNFVASGKEYRPRNYDGLDHGLVTMRQALQGSLNVPAVKTLYLVGIDAGVQFAERMGYTTLSQGNFGLSLVLGGGEVRLIEHTAAYATFANNGLKMKPLSILRVEGPSGDILLEQKPQSGERVLDPKITATISNVLSDDAARAYIFGRGGVLTLKDRPVAVKTGTTNEYIDAWTMGYTPSLATGVWVGNTNSDPMKSGSGGNKMAGVVWHQFMQEALSGTPVENFPDPPPNDAVKPVLRGSVGGITLPIDRITGNIANSSTPPEYIINRTFVPPHDILQYVNKDDPRGPAPTDPGADPQYALWETSIQEWVTRNQNTSSTWNISFEEPPTEVDDAPSFELLPSLEIPDLTPSSTLTSRELNIVPIASAPRGVARITYRLDGRTLATIDAPPFALHEYLAGVGNGPHTLTVLAEDDSRNRRLVTIPFTLAAGADTPYATWLDQQLTLSGADFPRTVFIKPFGVANTRFISIYRQLPNGSNRAFVGTIDNFSQLFEGHVLFTLTDSPGSGDWRYTLELTTSGGQTVSGGSMDIHIE